MTYPGFWIVCCHCLFPIRLPHFEKTWPCLEPAHSIPILLACPVCGCVEQYGGTEFKAIAFRVPDPFLEKKATLYVVKLPCRVPHCDHMLRIYTVAATDISIASLLELWKHWVIDHSFKPRGRWTWGVYGVPVPEISSRHFARP